MLDMLPNIQLKRQGYEEEEQALIEDDKNIIKENSVYFEESMSCGEDLDFVCRYCQCIKSLTFISDITYNYYLMEGSSSLSQKFYPNILVLIEQSNKELAKLYKEQT